MKVIEAIEKYGDIVEVLTEVSHSVRHVHVDSSLVSASFFFQDVLDLDIDDEEFDGRLLVNCNLVNGSEVRNLLFLKGDTLKYKC